MSNTIQKVVPANIRQGLIDLLLVEFSFYIYTVEKKEQLFIRNDKTKMWYHATQRKLSDSHISHWDLSETFDLPEEFCKMYMKLGNATGLKTMFQLGELTKREYRGEF